MQLLHWAPTDPISEGCLGTVACSIWRYHRLTQRWQGHCPPHRLLHLLTWVSLSCSFHRLSSRCCLLFQVVNPGKMLQPKTCCRALASLHEDYREISWAAWRTEFAPLPLNTKSLGRFNCSPLGLEYYPEPCRISFYQTTASILGRLRSTSAGSIWLTVSHRFGSSHEGCLKACVRQNSNWCHLCRPSSFAASLSPSFSICSPRLGLAGLWAR